MIIRSADLKDLNTCALFNTSYTTDRVWQIRTEERPYEEIAVTFQTIKLPRSVRAASPRDSGHLVEDWQRGECFLVAEGEEEIRGYLNMIVEPSDRTGWVRDLTVASRYRRSGIGSGLLRAALRWAREHGLRTVLVETQTKNYPAICFCRKHGFLFCGFNDHYYSNQDIAIFFSRNV
jgi:ribosomal protein S18 acetylase RimI-like enzyme